MDLFSRKIAGWSLDDHMQESLVLDALKSLYHNVKYSLVP